MTITTLAIIACLHTGLAQQGSAHGFSAQSAPRRLSHQAVSPRAFFGSSVAVDGSTIVVGAWGEAADGQDVGAAYVYYVDEAGDRQTRRLVSQNRSSGMRFGHSVAVSGGTVMIGAVTSNSVATRAGSVHIFERKLGGWTEVAVIVPPNPAEDALFGNAIDLDGDTALIGASRQGAGVVYVFVKEADSWREDARLVPPPGVEDAQFGASVALHGELAVVGAPKMLTGDQESDDETPGGGAVVFERDGSLWRRRAVLSAPPNHSSLNFGHSVTVLDRTSTVVVGSPEVVGRAYIFARKGDTYQLWAELMTPDGAGDHFGVAIAAHGDRVVIGAPGSAERSGAAYSYVWSDDTWMPEAVFKPDPQAGRSQFGISVAMDATRVVFGATGYDEGGIASGAAFVMDLRDLHAGNNLEDASISLLPTIEPAASTGELMGR